MATRKDFNKFVKGYMEAALWSSTDGDGESLDADHSSSDLAPETRRQMKSDCVKFMRANKKDLAEYVKIRKDEDGMTYTMKPGWVSAGHDFWFTRNHHGVGFWDRDLGALGDRLAKACKKFSEVNLYVGDDGKIYSSP